MTRLGTRFFERPVCEVARELIGCELLVGGTGGVIVETEAYHQDEPACHAHVGLTPRTRTLFGPPGRAYVYLSYGIHSLLNAVCEPEGTGAAVLIRALEPRFGLERMATRRGVDDERLLCSGPGRLGEALGITLGDDGRRLDEAPFELRRRRAQPAVAATRRIGISRAAELPWRFCDATSRHLSRPLPALARAA